MDVVIVVIYFLLFHVMFFLFCFSSSFSSSSSYYYYIFITILILLHNITSFTESIIPEGLAVHSQLIHAGMMNISISVLNTPPNNAETKNYYYVSITPPPLAGPNAVIIHNNIPSLSLCNGTSYNISFSTCPSRSYTSSFTLGKYIIIGTIVIQFHIV